MNYFVNSDHIILSDIKNTLSLASLNKWDEAHQIAQKKEGHPAYDRVHALLHRMEGDQFNARYWYNRIGEKLPSISFNEEIKQLQRELALAEKDLK